MAVTYKVKKGDTLYAIGRRYGIPWTAIFNANRSVVPSARTLGIGTTLIIPTSKNTPGATNTNTGTEIARKAFSEAVPWEKFLPTDSINKFSESRVNPEYQRSGEAATNRNAWQTGLANTFRSGFAQKQAQDIVDANERARKGALADYVQQQTNLFSDLYAKEWDKYDKNPANYLPQYDRWAQSILK